jgi:hypothetical protein
VTEIYDDDDDDNDMRFFILNSLKHARNYILPILKFIISAFLLMCQSQWLRGLSRFTAARLLRWWVRIPTGAWMFVCFGWCVLLGRGLCDELITRSDSSYRLWRVVECGHETS